MISDSLHRLISSEIFKDIIVEAKGRLENLGWTIKDSSFSVTSDHIKISITKLNI